jgi:uncharacterized protein
MKTRCLLVVLLLLLGVAVSPVLAQSDVPATRADIVKLFEVMNIRQQMRLTMDSVMKQQSKLVRESLQKRFPEMTDEHLKRLDSAMKETLSDMPVDGMIDDMVPVYLKHLSKLDVEAMSSFYSTPTGKKLLAEMPAMTSESMQAAYPRMQAMMDKMMQRVEQMAEEEQKKTEASPKPATNKN